MADYQHTLQTTLLASLLLTAILFIIIRRYLRLRHIPGPFISSLTDLWTFSKVWRGVRYDEIIQKLHAEYGPVVRWGPNRVSFASAEAIPEIYGTRNVLPKGDSYSPMISYLDGREIATLLTLKDEKRVSTIKKHISGALSHNAWLRKEGEIDATLEVLVQRLKDQHGAVVRLNKWLFYWSADTLSRLAFGGDQGFLQDATDAEGVSAGVKARFEYWRKWELMPTLERLIYKGIFAKFIKHPSSATAQLAARRLQERQKNEKSDTDEDLLDVYLAASQKSPDTISQRDVLSLTITTISAGSDSTSTASSLVLAQLLLNPKSFARLEEELLEAKLSMPPAFSQLEDLPYLDAAFRESLRCQFPTGVITDRTVVQSPGMTICDVFVPTGTDVAVPVSVVSRDPDIYGANVEQFDPDRWLNVDEKKRQEMEHASLDFSWGRRICPGRHLARIEVKKAVATIITAFKMNLVGEPLLAMDGSTRVCHLNVTLESRK